MDAWPILTRDGSGSHSRDDLSGNDHTCPRSPTPMFANTEDVKQRVRDCLTKKHGNVFEFYKNHGACQRIAKSRRFESATLLIIALNAVWLAIDTDCNTADVLLDAHWVFQVAENMFCAYFTFEWVVRFVAFKSKKDCLRDKWFVFDSILVLLMVLETWVMSIVILSTGGGQNGNVGNASVLRLVRLLRLSRMARMARLLRAMPELMIMIKGIVAATRSVFFTIALLVLVMYVFSIALTQLTADLPVGKTLFSSVGGSMYTLLITGTLLDNIGKVVTEIAEDSFAVAAVFMAFVLLGALTIMNMLIGVLCEVVSHVACMEKEEMAISFVNNKLSVIMDKLDRDGDNCISKEEFRHILDQPEAIKALHDVDVDPLGLLDLADFIFEEIDDDDCSETGLQERQLSFCDFIQVVFSLRGSNQATVKDLMTLHKFIRNTHLQTRTYLESCFENLRDVLEGGTPLNQSRPMSRRSSKGKSLHRKKSRAGLSAEELLAYPSEGGRHQSKTSEFSTRRVLSSESIDVPPGEGGATTPPSEGGCADNALGTGIVVSIGELSDFLPLLRDDLGSDVRDALAKEPSQAAAAEVPLHVRGSLPDLAPTSTGVRGLGARMQASKAAMQSRTSRLQEPSKPAAAEGPLHARESPSESLPTSAGRAHSSSRAQSSDALSHFAGVLPGTPAMPEAHSFVAKEMRRRSATVGELRPPRDCGGDGKDEVRRPQGEAAHRRRVCRTLSPIGHSPETLRPDLGL